VRRRRFSSHPEVEEAGREASEMRGRSRAEAGGSGGGNQLLPATLLRVQVKMWELGGPATARLQLYKSRERRGRTGARRRRHVASNLFSCFYLPLNSTCGFRCTHQAIVFGFSTFHKRVLCKKLTLCRLKS
jgi:hypothetical protein